MPRRSRSTASAEEETANTVVFEDIEEEEDSKPFIMTQTQFTFSQQPADRSQAVDTAKQSEFKKLDDLASTTRNRIITDLSRILLFKALGMKDPIDRTKVCSEALGETKGLSKAALNEAEKRLRDVFGFGVKKVPACMEENLPARFKNRLYLINEVVDDDMGTHSLNLHSANRDTMTEKGVLMMVLAFAFCKGTSQVRSGLMKGAGKKTRWISEHHLYALLHRVDENIPSEPPSAEGRRKSSKGGGSGGRQSLGGAADGGVSDTPDIDTLLEKFVAQDYLLRDKIDEGDEGTSGGGEDGKVIAYAMGPRAAMEIGRRQVVYFCSNVLDENPDPTMLAEIDEDDESSEEEEEEEVEEEVEAAGRKKRQRRG